MCSMILGPSRALLMQLGIALGATSVACNTSDATAPGAETRTPTEVGVVSLRTQDVVLTAELPGRGAAYESSEVRPQVSGIIQERLFTEGQIVEQGQTLYKIDPRLHRAALAQARADLEGAMATEVGARERAARFEALAAEGLSSALELTETKAAAGQAVARVEQARAALESARINLQFTQVAAPISGRIGRSLVTTGALVTAGQPLPLTTIHRLDPIFVDLQQSSAESVAFRRSLAMGSGTSANVRLQLEDGSMYAHAGTLQFSEVVVDPSTGSVTLRARFPNPEHVLLPGMYVRAVVQQGERKNAILAPQRGVTRDSRGLPVALVVGAGDLVERREIVTSRAVGESWLVESGLGDGDRLIVEGSAKVKPGDPVRAVAYVASDAPIGSSESQQAPDTNAPGEHSERVAPAPDTSGTSAAARGEL